MTRRRRRKPTSAPARPQYEWALASGGRPVHISQAERGAEYTCPVCQSRMVAKLGAIKRHHYAHEDEHLCEPAEVARIAARRWLTLELRAMVQQRRGVILSWPCSLCEQTHSANLLHSILAVQEQHEQRDGLLADVALLDGIGRLSSVILLAQPAQAELRRCVDRDIMVLQVEAESRRLTPAGGVEAFLAGARIYGGVCTTQQAAAAEGVVTGEDALRRELTDAVAGPPHFLYGALEPYRDLTHVLHLDDKQLWLPPILWQRAIGGLHHAVHPAVQIVSQEWPQPDGATIALYYITVRNGAAIAVRRFPPGETVYARLDQGVLDSPRLSALTVARNFAEK